MRFDDKDLVYGLYGKHAGRAEDYKLRFGGQLLSDLDWPELAHVQDVTIEAMEKALTDRYLIHFTLAGIDLHDLPLSLAGSGRYSETITIFELRYLMKHWLRFQHHVHFYCDDKEVPAPWTTP